MGQPSDLVRGVIEGNLAGANDHVRETRAKIAELQSELERFEAEQAEYARLLEQHEAVTS